MSEIPPPHQNPGYSNYPRYTPNPNPYQRPPGIYFEVIGEAWRIVQANLGNWVLATLVYYAVSWAVSIPLSLIGNVVAYGTMVGAGFGGGSQPNISALLISQGFAMLGVFITLPLQAGFAYMALKQVRGEIVGPGDIFSAFSVFWQVVLGYFLVGLLTLAGGLACIIPMFYVIGVLTFVPLLIVDRKMTAIEAITASYEALKAHGWMMFLLLFVLGLVTCLGACACGIGILVTLPVGVIGQALIYNNFFPPLASGFGGQQIGIEPPR